MRRQCGATPRPALMSLFFKFRTRGSGGGGGVEGMECGGSVATTPGAGAGAGQQQRSPARAAGLHVNFSDKGEVKERREKFLTAKYGTHQMALIRKRLAVEMWLYDELQKLFECATSTSTSTTTRDVDVDIDYLLDMDNDEHRRDHLEKLLADAKKPQKDVNKFISDLLEKAKTL